MARQVKCECGYVAQASTEDEVVDLIQRHLQNNHPQLMPSVTRDDIRGWVEIVPG